MSKCPCEQCICYAMCIHKKRTACSILWDYISQSEGSPHTAFQEARKLIPHLETVGNLTKMLSINYHNPHFRLIA